MKGVLNSLVRAIQDPERSAEYSMREAIAMMLEYQVDCFSRL